MAQNVPETQQPENQAAIGRPDAGAPAASQHPAPDSPKNQSAKSPDSHNGRPKTYKRFGLLQLIGVFKLLKGAACLVAAMAALHLVRSDDDEVILQWAHWLHIAPGNKHLGELLVKLLAVTHHQWEVIATVLAAYAAMFLTEGVGLLLNKHWAEWMTIFTTCGLIPLEIYEVVFHFTWGKVATLVINALAAVYLIVRVRRDALAKHRQGFPVIMPS